VEDITLGMVRPFLEKMPEGKADIGAVDLGFIKNLEGFHPTAYYDGAQNSWGYGTKAGTGAITREQAEQEMKAYLEKHCLPIIPDGLSPNKTTALASFCYNLGPAQAQATDLWKAAHSGGNVNFLGYTRSTTGVSLLPRRQKEQSMWNGQ
jgi:GH24 family phage-related lysozyme (muramidase)